MLVICFVTDCQRGGLLGSKTLGTNVLELQSKTLGTNVLELQFVLCWQTMIKT